MIVFYPSPDVIVYMVVLVPSADVLDDMLLPDMPAVIDLEFPKDKLLLVRF